MSEKSKINEKYSYKSEYAQQLIDHMAKGYSFSTFCVNLKVTPKCLYDWVDRYEDFADAKCLGENSAKYLFESQLIQKSTCIIEKPDSSIEKFMLNARFREEYSENKNSNVKVERLEDLINSLTTPEE